MGNDTFGSDSLLKASLAAWEGGYQQEHVTIIVMSHPLWGHLGIGFDLERPMDVASTMHKE